MVRAILTFILLFLFPPMCYAISDPIYLDKIDMFEDAIEADIPPFEYVQEVVDDLNSNPYFNLSSVDVNVYIGTQYPSSDNDYAPGVASLGTIIYSDGRVVKSCDFIFNPLRDTYNKGNLVYIAGCAKDLHDRCSIYHIAYHEMGHCIDHFYWTPQERTNYVNALGYNISGSIREFLAEEFAKIFSPLSARYQIKWEGESKYCALKYSSKPYAAYWCFYMNTKYDNPDLNNVEERVKYDVNNDGKVDKEDMFLAQSLINKRVTDDNIGYYWSADVNCDNRVTNEDAMLIYQECRSEKHVGDSIIIKGKIIIDQNGTYVNNIKISDVLMDNIGKDATVTFISPAVLRHAARPHEETFSITNKINLTDDRLFIGVNDVEEMLGVYSSLLVEFEIE